METGPPITELLAASARGDAAAGQRLWELVYAELWRIAAHQMASERRGATLQPTALVHEAYLRLFDGNGGDYADRTHFFVTAARIMRHIRVDDARSRRRLKRGGGRGAVPLDRAASVADGRTPSLFNDDPAEVLALDEALERLRGEAPDLAEIVVLRYYGGLTREQIAAALGIAPRTVDKRWSFARAWLRRELHGD